MAEDKRIRIAADTTPLRQLREEAVSLYREINQTSMQSAQEAREKHFTATGTTCIDGGP